MEEIVLFIHAQRGLTKVGQIRLHTRNVQTTDDYLVEPENLLTLEDIKSICSQRQQAPEAKYGQVRNFEWQESQAAPVLR